MLSFVFETICFTSLFHFVAFVVVDLLFLESHPTKSVILALVFALREALCLIIGQELLGNAALALFFGESLLATLDATIVNDSSDLEVGGQDVTVGFLVEAFGENVFSEPQNTQICLQLFSQLLLGQVSPIFSSRQFLLNGTLLLLQLDVVQWRYLLGISRQLAKD